MELFRAGRGPPKKAPLRNPAPRPAPYPKTRPPESRKTSGYDPSNPKSLGRDPNEGLTYTEYKVKTCDPNERNFHQAKFSHVKNFMWPTESIMQREPRDAFKLKEKKEDSEKQKVQVFKKEGKLGKAKQLYKNKKRERDWWIDSTEGEDPVKLRGRRTESGTYSQWVMLVKKSNDEFEAMPLSNTYIFVSRQGQKDMTLDEIKENQAKKEREKHEASERVLSKFENDNSATNRSNRKVKADEEDESKDYKGFSDEEDFDDDSKETKEEDKKADEKTEAEESYGFKEKFSDDEEGLGGDDEEPDPGFTEDSKQDSAPISMGNDNFATDSATNFGNAQQGALLTEDLVHRWVSNNPPRKDLLKMFKRHLKRHNCSDIEGQKVFLKEILKKISVLENNVFRLK